MLGCWPLDHSITVLATILHPVVGREEFLHHLRQTALPEGGSDKDKAEKNTSEEKCEDNVWVVVDSSGEEEEDPAQLWASFNENDVVQVRYRIYLYVFSLSKQFSFCSP